MKRFIRLATAGAVLGLGGGVSAFAVPASATPAQGTTSLTTLDACGYFVGYQTPATNQTDGATTTQRGTWVGVWNNYVMTSVASLGTVQGSFVMTTSPAGANGLDTLGTEVFASNAGKIYQSFTYGPDVPGGFSVDVTATRDLSFLTSSTSGTCYTGPFPRP